MADWSEVQITVKDFDNETTTITVRGAPAAVDGSDAATVFGLQQGVVNAVSSLVLGEVQTVAHVLRKSRLSTAKASSKSAQREVKLLVSGAIADIFKRARVEVGTFDLSKLADLPAGHVGPAFLDLSTGDGAALKTALDNYWQAGDEVTKAVTADEAIHVGRNT